MRLPSTFDVLSGTKPDRFGVKQEQTCRLANFKMFIQNTAMLPPSLGVRMDSPTHTVDVTPLARYVQFGRPVLLDAETFGVTVTRRETADTSNLTPPEAARLLDLLIAAKPFIGCCDEELRQFEHWVVSSDARDNRPRCVWMQISLSGANYVITMTDA